MPRARTRIVIPDDFPPVISGTPATSGRKIFQLPSMWKMTNRMMAIPVMAMTHLLPIADP